MLTTVNLNFVRERERRVKDNICRMVMANRVRVQFINSFTLLESTIAPLQVYYYSEALPTQHVYCVGVSRRSATCICERRTCTSSPRGG